MAEPGVREIQLSRKQLVFLFMASVVAVVVVFLLGVSVGRGARSSAPPPLPNDAGPTTDVPAAAPPGTKADAGSLSYPNLANGGDAAKSGGTPAPIQAPQPAALAAAAATSAPPPAQTASVPAPPPAVPPAPKTSSPAPVKSPPSSTKPAPPPAKASTPAPTKTTPPPAGSYFVQVESFRSKDLADNLVTKLRTKGYDVYVVDSPKPLLRVRVGPYKEKTGADEALGKLRKDGFTSAFVSR